MDITKLEIEINGIKKIHIVLDDLSGPLKRKLKKEIQRFINPKQVINEPIYNEERR